MSNMYALDWLKSVVPSIVSGGGERTPRVVSAEYVCIGALPGRGGTQLGDQALNSETVITSDEKGNGVFHRTISQRIHPTLESFGRAGMLLTFRCRLGEEYSCQGKRRLSGPLGSGVVRGGAGGKRPATWVVRFRASGEP